VPAGSGCRIAWWRWSATPTPGKSTLFNHLTRADVQAADMLFATLDPTLRALSLPAMRQAMLSDTVDSFPICRPNWVAAFRATLEEVLEADIILMSATFSHEDAEAQERDVDAVLRQLGIDPDAGQRLLEVWNKIDRSTPRNGRTCANIRRPPAAERPCFLVSAETGEGIEALLVAIEGSAGSEADDARSVDRRLRRRRHQLAAPKCRSAQQGTARRPF